MNWIIPDIAVWIMALLCAWFSLLTLLLVACARRYFKIWCWGGGIGLLIAAAVATNDLLQNLADLVAPADSSWLCMTTAPLVMLCMVGYPLRWARPALWKNGGINTATTPRLGLFLWSGMLTAWVTGRYFLVMQGVPLFCSVENQLDAVSGELLPVPDTHARTDSGRLIPLYIGRAVGGSGQITESPTVLSSGYVILRQNPDPRYNCHGWVFTGGQYALRGMDVEIILEDNGYSEVKNPAVGDIVVYRDELNRVIHTAVVRAILDNGTPLLESKWGYAGRFLHRPDEQVYSLNYRYYRTRRPVSGSGGLGVLAQHQLAIVRRSAIVSHLETVR